MRIGLSTRIIQAENYLEPRDALAQDWARFLGANFPSIQWMAVPNIGQSVVEYVKAWGLEGIILTGGNDIGQAPLRDESEIRLLRHCLRNSLPVLGICRGLQLMINEFGGKLVSVQNHSGSRHSVTVTEDFGPMASGQTFSVNSFHNFGVAKEDVPRDLAALAVSHDGYVEAIQVRNQRAAAVIWHPEREQFTIDPLARWLFESLFLAPS